MEEVAFGSSESDLDLALIGLVYKLFPIFTTLVVDDDLLGEEVNDEGLLVVVLDEGALEENLDPGDDRSFFAVFGDSMLVLLGFITGGTMIGLSSTTGDVIEIVGVMGGVYVRWRPGLYGLEGDILPGISGTELRRALILGT